MNDLYLFAAIMAVLGVGAMMFKDLKGKGRGKSSFNHAEKSQSKKLSYRLVWKFFNDSEEAFYFELKKQLPENYHVFSKVRLIDFIEPTGGQSYFSSRGKVWSRHVDFLVCNSYFKPVIAMEVNGKSHKRQDRVERDQFVQKLCNSVNLPLKFVNVGESFESSIKVLISELSN